MAARAASRIDVMDLDELRRRVLRLARSIYRWAGSHLLAYIERLPAEDPNNETSDLQGVIVCTALLSEMARRATNREMLRYVAEQLRRLRGVVVREVERIDALIMAQNAAVEILESESASETDPDL